jgi:hypothetical protein
MLNIIRLFLSLVIGGGIGAIIGATVVSTFAPSFNWLVVTGAIVGYVGGFSFSYFIMLDPDNPM